MLRGSYRPGHNQLGRGFGGGGRRPFPGGRNPAIPSRLEATLVLHRAPRDPPREASPSPTSRVASPATSPTSAPTRTATTPARAPTPGGRPPQAAPPPAAGRERLNYLTEEEASDAPDVMIGEFLVCGTTALVLFDTGATGSYVTSWFVNKLSLPTNA
jgi:hypothetical protein